MSIIYRFIFLLFFIMPCKAALLAQPSQQKTEQESGASAGLPVENFDGVTNFTGADQSDTHGAVGPNHVMSISNLGFEISDKSGKSISGQISDQTFFAPLASYGLPLRDGRLVYDPFGHRWIFIVLYSASDSMANGFFIAISSSDDPTGMWNMWPIQTTSIDYPTLGFNKKWICVDNNRSSQLYIFNKSYMYNHSSKNIPRYKTIGNISGIWQPCQTLDSLESNLYLIKNDQSKLGTLAVAKITGNANSPVFTMLPEIYTGHTWSSPASINYPQLGTDNSVLCYGKDEMMNAVFIDDAIWCAQGIGLLNPTRAGFQWWEIDPEQSSVLQYEQIEDSTGVYYYCMPSIAVDYYKNVLVGCSIFSETCYISAGYLLHPASENANAHDTLYFYKNGESIYTKQAWGDYSVSVLDPVNHSLWTVQAYANQSNDWTTRWANFNVQQEDDLEKKPSVAQQLKVELYPNPSQDQLMVNFGSHEDKYTLNVLNSKGESLGEWVILSDQTKFEINTSQLTTGIYYLKIQSISGSRLLRFEVNR